MRACRRNLLPCRYGYGSAEFYSQILNGYGNASIPLETFVSDSQYMDHDQDFTFGDKFPMSDMKVRLALARRGDLCGVVLSGLKNRGGFAAVLLLDEVC